jgi:alpha-L-arabinofuranosidase
MKNNNKKSVFPAEKKSNSSKVSLKEKNKDIQITKKKKSSNGKLLLSNVELNEEISSKLQIKLESLKSEKLERDVIKEFTRNALLKKNDSNKNSIDNNNFMFVILRLSGLDLSDKLEETHFPDKNFPDLNLIQEVIASSSTSNDKVKLKKINEIADAIFTEIYYK